MGTAALVSALLISAVNAGQPEPKTLESQRFIRRWQSDYYEVHGKPWELKRVQARINDCILKDWKEIYEKEMFWLTSYTLAERLYKYYENANGAVLTLSTFYYDDYFIEELGYKPSYLPTMIEFVEGDK